MDLSEFPLGQDVVVSLPDPLNGHGGSKEAISNAKNRKYNYKHNHQRKACFH